MIFHPDETPNLFGIKAFNVSSGSMEPTLEIGDVVLIKIAKQEDINKYDIITFRQEETIITHRIVEVLDNSGNKVFKTKGDNNNTNDDELVKYDNIEGIYICRIPKIGVLINYAQNTTVIISILIILYIIYKVFQIKDDRKNARHERRMQLEEKKK